MHRPVVHQLLTIAYTLRHSSEQYPLHQGQLTTGLTIDIFAL